VENAPHGGDQAQTVNIHDYLQAIRRRWRVVLVVTLAAVCIGLALSARQTPRFLASTEILVEPTQDVTRTQSGIILQPEEVATQREVIASRTVAEAVIDDLGLQETAQELLMTLVVDAIDETRVLKVSVQRRDPAEAAAIANSFADSYIELRTAQATRQLETLRTALQGQADDLREQIAALDEAIALVPDADKPELTAERQNLIIQLGQLSADLDEVRNAELGQGPVGSVLLPAIAPEQSTRSPLVRTAALAGLLGLLMGIAAALVRDRMDDTIRREESLAALARKRPVLGRIPRQHSRSAGNGPAGRGSPVGEAYQSLAANVRFLVDKAVGTDGRGRILLVASAEAGAGRTSVAVNLALAVARAGHRVVLVDGDLRSPSVADVLQIEFEPGLAELIKGSVSADHGWLSFADLDLRVVPAGRTDGHALDLLASAQVAERLADVARDCDLVVVDSTPVLDCADTVELVQAVDMAVVVARTGRSRAHELLAAVNQLEAVGGSVIGWVLNHGGQRHGEPRTRRLAARSVSRIRKGTTDAFGRPKSRHRGSPHVSASPDGTARSRAPQLMNRLLPARRRSADA
jgi:capsular exopolysaccharide synthesis family protein